jgi:fused signal recognition particle receptor
VRPLFRRIADGLARTREAIAGRLATAIGATTVDPRSLAELETALLAADVGPDLTEEILEAVRRGAASRLPGGTHAAVRAALLAAIPELPKSPAAPSPHVVFVVGVNGGGKTTTIGKLAARERALGRRVIVVAADTFRAAAIDQLERWAERAEVEIVKQREGSDPAAVVFDALRAARARGLDRVLVDTAGRLHTKVHLMAELGKLTRIAGREVEGAPHEVLLVVDATTGQNGLAQAEQFAAAARVTGVVLTKLDGTAKGGVVLSIQRKLGAPVRWVGVGEQLDDLIEFDREAFVDGLLGPAP